MSRRDTIILAVLINATLLSVLFFMATRPETAQKVTSPAIQRPVASVAPQVSPSSGFVATRPQIEDRNEPVLSRSYTAPREEAAQPVTSSNFFDDHVSSSVVAEADDEPQPVTQPQEQFVEVLVKRGDFLQRIARTNGTTPEEIKRINNLTSDRIDIGQVLLVPAKKVATAKAPAPVKQEVEEAGAEYYVLKPNDNLWNLSRQLHVNFDDLLTLNNLDENKARTLKPGDKIRVR